MFIFCSFTNSSVRGTNVKKPQVGQYIIEINNIGTGIRCNPTEITPTVMNSTLQSVSLTIFVIKLRIDLIRFLFRVYKKRVVKTASRYRKFTEEIWYRLRNDRVEFAFKIHVCLIVM